MQAVGIIPARIGSTRLPKKMLAKIGNKTLIQLTYENACKAKSLSKIIVATDDKEIFNNIKNISGNVVMTSPIHPSGTDRIAEAAKNISADIFVNIQGDEPLINTDDIDKLVKVFNNNNVDISTLAHEIDKDSALLPENVKVVFDYQNFALYFSRSIIPFNRDNAKDCKYFKHIGIYAYKSNILFDFVKLAQSNLEKIEKLEQLRALENGYKIKVVLTENKCFSIDVSADLEKLIRQNTEDRIQKTEYRR